MESLARETVSLWVDMAPYLLLGMFIAGVLHLFLREDFISRHLGGSSPGTVLKATLLGIPLPLCSCGVIPVAASLRREGASRGATMAFLVSTPTTGVDSVLATYSLMGPLFAVFRPLAALLSGLVVGGLSFLVEGDGEGHLHPPPRPLGLFQRAVEVFRYGFLELGREIGGWLVMGVLIGGAIGAFVPREIFQGLGGHPLVEALVLLAFSVPLYVCATGSIPVAAALIAKGVSPGAALVFLIAGPATNTVTLGFVYSQMGRRALGIYLGSIIAISLGLGMAFNALWTALGRSPELIAPGGRMLPIGLRAAAGVALLAVVVLSRLKREEETEVSEMKYTFRVPSMSCAHCKARIEEALRALSGVEEVAVDLKGQTVGVQGDVDPKEVEEALRKAGYPPD